jgi:hypothetical protein
MYNSLGFSSRNDDNMYVLMKKAPDVDNPAFLNGYAQLSARQREDFARYVVFQLGYALHLLGSIGCVHRDLAMGNMSHNLRYLEVPASEDPCGRGGAQGSTCSWGYCWSAVGSTWCFERAKNPMLGVIIQLFDFGKGFCTGPGANGWLQGKKDLVGAKKKWMLANAGVPDSGLLSRACGHLGLHDCPESFPSAIDSLQSPYFQRFSLSSAEPIPEGACVISTGG